MKSPWLSVLLPTYNGERYLRNTLNSIVFQKDLDIECIAIDDGSTDQTIPILASFQEKINLRIIEREPQKNWVTNTNYALSLAKADYVSFLHQDDVWLEDRLKILKSLITEFPQANFILNPSKFIDVQGNSLGVWTCPLPSYPKLIDNNFMIEKLLIQNFISIPAPIFKREIAIKVGGLDEKLWYTADWDFWLKLASCGLAIYYPKPLTAFRVHSNSQTVTRSSYIQDFRQQLELVANKHLESLIASPHKKNEIKKVSILSIEVNTSLASLIHGKKIKILPLILHFFSAGICGFYRYFRDSRILERVVARLKAKLAISK